jgi:hypothetical protein
VTSVKSRASSTRKSYVTRWLDSHSVALVSLALDSQSRSVDHSEQSRLLSQSLRTTRRPVQPRQRIRSHHHGSHVVEAHDNARSDSRIAKGCQSGIEVPRRLFEWLLSIASISLRREIALCGLAIFLCEELKHERTESPIRPFIVFIVECLQVS